MVYIICLLIHRFIPHHRCIFIHRHILVVCLHELLVDLSHGATDELRHAILEFPYQSPHPTVDMLRLVLLQESHHLPQHLAATIPTHVCIQRGLHVCIQVGLHVLSYHPLQVASLGVGH